LDEAVVEEEADDGGAHMRFSLAMADCTTDLTALYKPGQELE
jgi:hypothetical protein